VHENDISKKYLNYKKYVFLYIKQVRVLAARHVVVLLMHAYTAPLVDDPSCLYKRISWPLPLGQQKHNKNNNNTVTDSHSATLRNGKLVVKIIIISGITIFEKVPKRR